MCIIYIDLSISLSFSFLNAAPTGGETLTPNDAVKVLEELLPAQNHSHILGLKLGLPLHDVEGIQSNHHNPRDRLLKVITDFLRQEQTGPTWRVIVDALRSPVVNLPALAKGVEAAHFSDSTSTRDVVPETNTGMTCHSTMTGLTLSLSFQLQSLVSALPLTPLVMWSNPRHYQQIL